MCQVRATLQPQFEVGRCSLKDLNFGAIRVILSLIKTTYSLHLLTKLHLKSNIILVLVAYTR